MSPTQPLLHCTIKEHLRKEFVVALWLFWQALNRVDPILGASEFDAAYEKATQAQLVFEKARDALRQHCAQHGCE